MGTLLLSATAGIACGMDSDVSDDPYDELEPSADDMELDDAPRAACGFPVGTHPALQCSNATWTPQDKTFKITDNVTFGGNNNIEGFCWNIPPAIKTLVIQGGKTLTGCLRMQTPMTIKGSTTNRSATIFGTDTTQWAVSRGIPDTEKWKYSGISVRWDAPAGAYKVKNLTIENARTYGVTAYNQRLVGDNIHILHTRGDNDDKSNSDGFGGGPNSVLRNSRVDVMDDSVKLYKNNMLVKNVTIVHRGNGAPFQLGWGNAGTTTATIDNVLVLDQENEFNLGLFSASNGSYTRNVVIKGLAAKYTTSPADKVWNGSWQSLPLFFMKSGGAQLNLTAGTSPNVDIKAPIGKRGPGSVSASGLCGSNGIKKSYKCGQAVTGCGW